MSAPPAQRAVDVRGSAFAAFALACVLLGLFAAATFRRNALYRDGTTVWMDAAQKSPNKARVYNNLGYSYIMLGGLLNREQRYAEAIDALNAAVELDPYNAPTYLARAMAYHGAGMLDMALEDYTTALTLRPDSADAFKGRGAVLSDLGKQDLAVADLDRAISLQPADADAYNRRGIAFGEQGRFGRAVADFDRAVQLSPDLADAYNNRGIALREQGEPERAAEDFRKACGMGIAEACGFAAQLGDR